MVATIKPGGGPVLPGRPNRRPAVLDASRAALIPLRPLTITEVLDAAFLVVRANARMMVGLPLVVAGAAGLYLLGGIGLWFLLGDTSEETVQIVTVVLYGLLGLLLLTMCVVWMTAVLSRITLETVLGPGFVPPTQWTLRRALRLFWPMVGLSLLQWVAASTMQSIVVSGIYFLLIAIMLAMGSTGASATMIGIVSTAISVIGYVIAAAAYSYLSLAVPAYATEHQHAPAWIGTPARRTNIITAFLRSFALIGLRNLPRSALIMAGATSISLLVITLVGFGSLLVLLLYTTSFGVSVFDLLANPWTYVGVFGFSSIVALSALLAFVAAAQTLLYVDLRMRREGLDLAMRFDSVPIPQPSAPPIVYLPPPLPMPLPPPPPPPPMAGPPEQGR